MTEKVCTDVLGKVPQIYGVLLGYPEKHHFLCKTGVTFGKLMDRIGLLFISTSGHTDSMR